MRLKNILLILVISIFAVVLAACAGSSSQGSSTANSTGTEACPGRYQPVTGKYAAGWHT